MLQIIFKRFIATPLIMNGHAWCEFEGEPSEQILFLEVDNYSLYGREEIFIAFERIVN